MATSTRVSKWQAIETEAKKLVAKPFTLLKDVEDIGEKTVAVVREVRVLTPQFRAELTQLIDDINPVAAALQPVISSDGTNVGADLTAIKAALPDVKKLVKDFLAFIPTVEAAVKVLKSDVQTTPISVPKPVAVTFDEPEAVPTADYVAYQPATETVERTD